MHRIGTVLRDNSRDGLRDVHIVWGRAEFRDRMIAAVVGPVDERDVIMNTTTMIGAAATVTVALLCIGSVDAGAQSGKQNKVTLQQAWNICMKWLNEDTPATAENQQQRYYRGAACLAKYGYDFKSVSR